MWIGDASTEVMRECHWVFGEACLIGWWGRISDEFVMCSSGILVPIPDFPCPNISPSLFSTPSLSIVNI